MDVDSTPVKQSEGADKVPAPAILSPLVLSAIIAEMSMLVRKFDSFDGHITYSATPNGYFEVWGSYKFGNSEGQGGTRIIRPEWGRNG